jgi:hypothetical protein
MGYVIGAICVIGAYLIYQWPDKSNHRNNEDSGWWE